MAAPVLVGVDRQRCGRRCAIPEQARLDFVEADVGNKVATAADGLDGSTTQWAARLVGEHVKEVADKIATNVNNMGTAVRGAAGTYEVNDADLAGSFKGIF